MSAADESEDGYMYQVEYNGSYFEEATEITAMQRAEYLITRDVGLRLAAASDALHRVLRAARVLQILPAFTTVDGAIHADRTQLLEPQD